MALGGGVWVTQSKVLPGSYINFTSAARATASLSERGYAAIPLTLDWGVDGEIFTVTSEDFRKHSLQIFGYDYSSSALMGLRDLFKNAQTGYFYKLNQNGTKAANIYAAARYTGTRGNDITITIQYNELSSSSDVIFNVSTLMDSLAVDVQVVRSSSELKENGYVTFDIGAALELTAGTPLTGGTNGTVSNADYQNALDKFEGYGFNTLGCLSEDSTIKALFAAYTRRMRDEVGVKFQCVIHRYSEADYEGVISVENNDTPGLVYWVTGAEAGCAVNASTTNNVYNGEYTVDTNYTQAQLEASILSGEFVFHKTTDTVRVLEDINTYTTFTDIKSKDFSSNQTMRVLDQIGNDIALLFNSKYIGHIPNDNAGRMSLWNDIVTHHRELERIRAIENFQPDALTVEQGDTKKAVVVVDYVTPINAMSQLYMTVVVE